MHLNQPIVGMAATTDHRGYWLVGADGGVFAFGNAGFFGSIPGLGIAPEGSPTSGPRLASPIVGMVASSNDRGYLLVAADGGVFAFGDARFVGSCPGSGRCTGATTAIVPGPTGSGYWIVTALGRVYPFGDVSSYGQPGPQRSAAVGALRSPSGKGYWILLADGAILAYGDARQFGRAAGLSVATPATAICGTVDGDGLWITTPQGKVVALGSATNMGGYGRLSTSMRSIVADSGF